MYFKKTKKREMWKEVKGEKERKGSRIEFEVLFLFYSLILNFPETSSN